SEKSDEKKEKKSGKKEFDPILSDINGKEESKEKKKADSSDGRIKASPLAKKMAEDKEIDLGSVTGSGPDGRIIKRDIEDYKSSPVAKGAAADSFDSEESEDIKISQMRKTIARRLSESKFTNPHFYETIDIDMEHAMAARTKLNEVSDVKISFNDIVVKACAVALRRHPAVNSSWLDEVIRKHGDVNVAVAVAVDEGLMTPVIRHADKKNLRQISAETRELAGLARDRKLQPEQMEGSTFTISNLGMFGIEEFTAIINPPNACILAVGAIRNVPVVKDGAVVPGHMMKVTLSSDHRIVDGAKAAEFLTTLRQLLENPLSMLL
ncbi:MAG: dihydrolipoamide acetyltransferase family protein, partial [Balneolaceae bacterium]